MDIGDAAHETAGLCDVLPNVTLAYKLVRLGGVAISLS